MLLKKLPSSLSCLYCHSEHVIRWRYSLWLQRYRCKIPDCRKTFNNFT
ncbi:MAG: IS1/IS1595 family N-terminal zinc-binding domain-containing protein [Arsenophonus sp. NEOnobi-MAG3]